MYRNKIIRKIFCFTLVIIIFISQNFLMCAEAISSKNVTKLPAKGNSIKVFTQNEINTKNINKGDEIICVLDEDWMVKGTLVAPIGSIVKGEVSQIGYSKFHMRFNEIETPDSQIYKIKTEEIVMEMQLDLGQKTFFVVSYPLVKSVEVLYGSFTEVSNGFNSKHPVLGIIYVFSGAAPIVGAFKGIRGDSLREEFSIPKHSSIELKFSANAIIED